MESPNRPTKQRRGRPKKAHRPPEAIAQSLTGRIRICAKDLADIANDPKFPIKVRRDALPSLASKISDAFDQYILIDRGNSSTALRGEVKEWAESLEQWIEDGVTLLGGNVSEAASPAMASIVGPAGGAVALLTGGWPATLADSEESEREAQRLVALKHDLMRARVLTRDGLVSDPEAEASESAPWDHSVASQAETEVAGSQDDEDNPPEVSQHDATRSLVFNTLAALGSLQILAQGVLGDLEARHERRRRKGAREHLMRRLGAFYETIFERKYAASRSHVGDGEMEVGGPAVRWTRALFALCLQRVREEVEAAAQTAGCTVEENALTARDPAELAELRSAQAARAVCAAAPLHELDALVTWSTKENWGPEAFKLASQWNGPKVCT